MVIFSAYGPFDKAQNDMFGGGTGKSLNCLVFANDQGFFGKGYHECKDVDLAVWVDDLTQLRTLRRVASDATNVFNQTICNQEMHSGGAHQQVDVFIFEPGTNRYRGRLSSFGQCPKGKPECAVVWMRCATIPPVLRKL